MDVSVLNTIVLLGGVQSLTLCIYLAFYKGTNQRGKQYYILFLFCLSLFNLGYVAIFTDLNLGPLPAGAQPIPYKHILGPALFLYLLVSLGPMTTQINKISWLIMLPAIIYGAVRLYWVYMIVSGKNPYILLHVYQTGFFTVNELAYLTFNLVLGIAMLKKLRSPATQSLQAQSKRRHWQWFNTITKAFIAFTLVHLLIQLVSLTLHMQDSRLFYYPVLITNSIFVYWVGFIGFTKANQLFVKPVTATSPSPNDQPITAALQQAMEAEQLFKNPRLSAHQLAAHLKVPTHQLTQHINNQYGTNFSQYVNKYRTQEAIRLMRSPLAQKYTLEALATQAGFSSKSSFYKVFKAHTNQTPAAYMKTLS